LYDLIPVNKIEISINFIQILGGRRGRDPMKVTSENLDEWWGD
jgi:hypothetical protein